MRGAEPNRAAPEAPPALAEPRRTRSRQAPERPGRRRPPDDSAVYVQTGVNVRVGPYGAEVQTTGREGSKNTGSVGEWREGGKPMYIKKDVPYGTSFCAQNRSRTCTPF